MENPTALQQEAAEKAAAEAAETAAAEAAAATQGDGVMVTEPVAPEPVADETPVGEPVVDEPAVEPKPENESAVGEPVPEPEWTEPEPPIDQPVVDAPVIDEVSPPEQPPVVEAPVEVIAPSEPEIVDPPIPPESTVTPDPAAGDGVTGGTTPPTDTNGDTPPVVDSPVVVPPISDEESTAAGLTPGEEQPTATGVDPVVPVVGLSEPGVPAPEPTPSFEPDVQGAADAVTDMVPLHPEVADQVGEPVLTDEQVAEVRKAMPNDVEQVIRAIAMEAAAEQIAATVVEEAIIAISLPEPGTAAS